MPVWRVTLYQYSNLIHLINTVNVHTNLELKPGEGQSILKQYFIIQSVMGIKRKLQKLQRAHKVAYVKLAVWFIQSLTTETTQNTHRNWLRKGQAAILVPLVDNTHNKVHSFTEN